MKYSLNNMITKLIEDLNFDISSFFSDNYHRFGNIGVPESKDEIDKQINYLTSNESSIREKVTAITNSLINGADTEGKNRMNTKKLYEFIITSYNKGSTNRWLNERVKFIESIKTDSSLKIN